MSWRKNCIEKISYGKVKSKLVTSMQRFARFADGMASRHVNKDLSVHKRTMKTKVDRKSSKMRNVRVAQREKLFAAGLSEE